MKKLLSALLILALLLSLANCAAPQSPELPSENSAVQLPEQNVSEDIPEAAPQQSPETPKETPEEIPEESFEESPEEAPEEPPAQPEESSQPAQPEAQPQKPADKPSPPPADEPAEDPTEESTEAPTEESTEESTKEPTEESTEPAPYSYTGKDEVAAYIHANGCLPWNFITKSEARALGWHSGSVEKVAPGMCIGGDRFYNREGLLPDAPGRYYYECDIDTLGRSSRGAKRIVFSNDGLIYYTDDHYNSFTLLYGEP